jgi:hypothetical protein
VRALALAVSLVSVTQHTIARIVSDVPPSVSVLTPTVGVDPRIALATSMHAGAGVYAVLVGSGMSSAAGIPTGWRVVQDLVRKVAVVEGVDDIELEDTPESWWARRYGAQPRYDSLLQALAPTDAARQALLQEYFDPRASAGGPIQPMAGHRALAALCTGGRVRVIVTTNFDRLLERALADAGVPAQVIATADDLQGMTPLVHAPATVIKLNGDYAASMRNTAEELAVYPSPLRVLLDRVLDEYGLLVVGWSAEYDVGLASAISACPSRRYPTYWAAFHGRLGEAALRLVAQRPTSVIGTTGADELLVDLVDRIDLLDKRAARKGRPARLRDYSLPPEQASPPAGWAFLPLLQLRAVAAVGPVTLDTCGFIGPQEREGLESALCSAALTAQLYGLGCAPAASAIATDAPQLATATRSLGVWTPTPGGHQSNEHASYRLGGDAKDGVSALATVQLPRVGSFGGAMLFIIDIAISLATAIRLGDAATLWRDGLVLTSALLPAALIDILPAEADATQAELHAFAAATDGHQLNRPNDLAVRLDLSSLGSPTRPLRSSIGFAMRLVGALAEMEAADVVAQGIDHMALANGYLDPRVGMAGLRHELGLVTFAS